MNCCTAFAKFNFNHFKNFLFKVKTNSNFVKTYQLSYLKAYKVSYDFN